MTGPLEPSTSIRPPRRIEFRNSPLPWAIYLACSWTWCIGMFLPALMVRDFGLWGFVAFALPNVIGAAAVGFFTYRQPSGESLLDHHRPVMAAFSVVTICFHIFFAAWFIRQLIGPWGLLLPFAATALFYGYFSRPNGDLIACILALAISAAAAVVCLANPHGVGWPPADWAMSAHQTRDLACLAPGIAFAFLLCPHLDLTLQRARLASPPGLAPRIFVLGFVGFFLLLILFSLFYSGAILRVMSPAGRPRLTGIVLIALGVHMSIQSALTVALHLRQLPVRRFAASRPMEMTAALLVLAALLLWMNRPLPEWFGLTAGEMLYRAFLGFYGLVFPAYIWTAMIWRKPEPITPGRTTYLTVALIILLALPFFAMGFLARHASWILPGLALILAWPWILPRRRTAVAA